MKKLTLLLLLAIPFLVKATNYTSTTNGNWSSSSTWSPTGVPGSGDTVTIANTVTLDASESIKNITINSSKTLTVSSSNTLTVYGSFTNNGTFTYSTGTVTFAGSINQTMGGSSTTTFYNLTIDPSATSDTVFLNKVCTVNNNLTITQGVLDCETYKITGNTSGTMSMASGTTLVLGLPSSSTLPGFPSNFTNANISLNAASTVVYQANNTSTGQTVSAVPYYGNLLVTTSSAGTSGATLFFVKSNLTLSGSITFKENSATDTIKGNLTIGSGATYKAMGANEYLEGNLTVNGSYQQTSGDNCLFYGKTNQTISGPVNAPINITFGELWIKPASGTDTTYIEANILCADVVNNYYGTMFVPAAYNDSIEFLSNFNNYGTFTALNGVSYFTAGSSAEDVNINPATFYKLTTNTGFYLYCNAFVTSDYTHMSGVIVRDPGNLYVGGNFINNSSGAQSEQVTLNGNHNQYIQGSVAPEFYALEMKQAAATDTVFLSTAITVDHNLSDSGGVFDCQTYQVTGNNSYTFTLANNTGLVLGKASSSTNVSFPTLYTTGHTTLNAGSTVSYLANTAQTISTTPTYGNLVLGSGSSATRKTPASTTLAVAGNLNVNANTTLFENTGTLNLTGNLTNADTVLFTTGAMNIGGTFTNNGYYAYGTGTATFNGSANAQVNGSNAPEFYNLTLNTSATTDTMFLTHPVTVSNTLTLTKGIMDCEQNKLTNSSLPTISISPSVDTICAGNSVALTASGYSSYVWAPSSSLSASTGTSVTASPLGTVTYTVYGNTSNAYECASSTSSTGNVTVDFCNNSCANAVSLTDGTVSGIPINYSNMWYSFTASGNMLIVFIHNAPDTLHGRIKQLVLYSGTCSILDSITNDTLFPTSYYQDSVLIFNYNNLTSGNTYYLKVLSDNVNSSRKYSVYFHNTTSSCPAPPTCDLVSNGNFAAYNTCPQIISEDEIAYADCWTYPSPYFGGFYFNKCDGSGQAGVPSNAYGTTNSVVPLDGAYAGIMVHDGSGLNDDRFYIQENITSMTASTTYNISFYARLTDCSQYYVGTGNIGLFISNYQPTKHYPGSQTLVDNSGNLIPVADASKLISNSTVINSSSLGWVHITGTYTSYPSGSPSSGENWISIGNFYDYATAGTASSSCSDVQPSAIYYIDDVSITKAVNINITNTTICPGNSTTLSTSAGGWTSYSWSTGATTSTITVSPVTTSTYSVSVSDGSCSVNATCTVTVNPDPTVSASYSGTMPFCAGGSVTLTGSGANTYTWQPGSLTGSTITVGPINSTTYTVTGTSSLGCIGTNTIAVTTDPTCCYAPGAVQTFSNTTISGSYGPTSSPIVIDGTCTVSVSATFSGCSNVQMGGGAEIIVPDNTTLTLTNSGSDITRLYACGDMWQGIVVNPGTYGGTLDVSGNSIIEDAIQAIYTPTVSATQTPPTVSVINSMLNNNFYDVYIDACDLGSVFPLTLQGDSLTTSTDGTYSGPYLKYPHAGAITFTGVHLEKVTGFSGIQIGVQASSSTNTFSTMNYGVYGLNSNFFVYNNIFWNMVGKAKILGTANPIGIAVWGNSAGFIPGMGLTYNLAVIGGGAANTPNMFRNVFRGVELDNYVLTAVWNNTFSNTIDYVTSIFQSQLGDHAIYQKAKMADDIEIDSNTIINNQVGIELDRTYINNLSWHYPEHINYNALSISGSSSNYMNTGILAENTTPSQFAPTIINRNNVYDASNCILVRNFWDQRTLIDSNEYLRILNKTSPTTGTERSGIRVENCQDTLKIQNNGNIGGSGGIYTSNTYTSTTSIPKDTEVIGINIIHSSGILEQCNKMFSVGQCMRFTGNCYRQHIVSNIFADGGVCYDGIVLWNNSEIGQQGDATHPIGEEWTSPSTNFLRSMTYCLNTKTPGRYSALWMQSSSLPYYPTPVSTYNLCNSPLPPLVYSYQEPFPYIGLNTSTSGSAPSCGIPPICVPCINNHDPFMDGIALDSVDYVIDSVYARQINRQWLFNQVATYDTLRTNDTNMNNFYNAHLSTNLGKIYDIGVDINNGSYTDAGTLISSFSPADTIQANYKTVDSIYVYTLGAGVDTLDSLDFVHLYNIAYMCPDMGGMAVYQARSMLNLLTNSEWEFSDSCNTASGRVGHSPIKPSDNNNTSPVVNNNAKVYPNPANSLLNIEVQLPTGKVYEMCMYSSHGEKVICEELPENLTTLPINTLAPGIYYYRITDPTGMAVKADKIMIVH